NNGKGKRPRGLKRGRRGVPEGWMGVKDQLYENSRIECSACCCPGLRNGVSFTRSNSGGGEGNARSKLSFGPKLPAEGCDSAEVDLPCGRRSTFPRPKE